MDDASQTPADGYSQAARGDLPNLSAGSTAGGTPEDVCERALRAVAEVVAGRPHFRGVYDAVARVVREYGPVPEGHMRCGKCKGVTDDGDMWCPCGGDWEWEQSAYLGRIRWIAGENAKLRAEVAKLRSARAEILALAERQRALADDGALLSVEDRRLFAHAANQLRRAAELLGEGGANGCSSS